MPASNSLRLFTPYLCLSLEGVLHGVYLVWLTSVRGIPPVAAAIVLAAGDVALLALQVPTGVFADRLGARRSLLLGSALQVLGLVLFWKADTIAGVTAAAFAIAFGDAFRDGADEALLFRSCAAAGDAASFGKRYARAKAWSLAALVALTALGGVLVPRVGWDLAWALEVLLAVGGFAVAWCMREPPSAADDEDDDIEAPERAATPRGVGAVAALVPWALVVPATLASSFASAGQFLAQTAASASAELEHVAIAVAASQLAEAVGAAVVARGLVPLRARALDAFAALGTFAAVAVALAPGLLLPAVCAFGLAAGAAHAVRSPLVQEAAPDDARATVASAASMADMLGQTAIVPLAAWMNAKGGVAPAAGVLTAIALVGWLARAWEARVRARSRPGR
ncbi:MAG TPA: MFS transporter [Minicystis sp.]|nr:MFS transporter [Minicystis sp.]